jgi:hypothetical protein
MSQKADRKQDKPRAAFSQNLKDLGANWLGEDCEMGMRRKHRRGLIKSRDGGYNRLGVTRA